MGFSISTTIRLEADFPEGDYAKTWAKVKAEDYVEHRLFHQATKVKGTYGKLALQGLGRLVQVYTAYTLFSFAKNWLNDEIQRRDQILRAPVANTAKQIGDLAFEFVPHGGVIFGWAELFDDRVARVWIAGVFESSPDFKEIRGPDKLPYPSRYRPMTLDQDVVAFAAEVTRSPL